MQTIAKYNYSFNSYLSFHLILQCPIKAHHWWLNTVWAMHAWTPVPSISGIDISISPCKTCKQQ